MKKFYQSGIVSILLLVFALPVLWSQRSQCAMVSNCRAPRSTLASVPYGIGLESLGANKEVGGYSIYRLDNKNWTKIKGSAVRIAVDPKGNAWVVNKQRNIYRFDGRGWIKMPGAAVDIGIGAGGHVAVVGTNKVGGGFGVYRWTGKTWNSIPGGLTNLAVGPLGKIWGVNSSKNIFVHCCGRP